MKKPPEISVCIPVLDGAPYLGEAILSVLAQEGVSLELVICDNASGDASVEIARSFSDPRIHVHAHDDRVGMCANWNRAIGYAGACWIKVLPCDDRLTRGALARELSATRAHPAPSLVAGGKIISSRKGRPILSVRRLSPGLQDRESLRERLLRSPSNLLGEPGSVLFRREAWECVRGFDESLHYFCDVDFWIRLLDCGPAIVLKEASAFFRVHGGSMSFRQTGLIGAEFAKFRSKYLAESPPGFARKAWLETTIWARQAVIRLLDRF